MTVVPRVYFVLAVVLMLNKHFKFCFEDTTCRAPFESIQLLAASLLKFRLQLDT